MVRLIPAQKRLHPAHINTSVDSMPQKDGLVRRKCQIGWKISFNFSPNFIDGKDIIILAICHYLQINCFKDKF